MALSVPLGAQTFSDAQADYQAQNYGSAFKKFKMLAKQNDAQAQGLLAYMYLNGEGTAKNGREAVKWYKKSAAGDFYFAHLNLGNLYNTGDFVPQSEAKAGFHYKRCADLLGDNDRDGLCHEKTAFALWNRADNTKTDDAQKYFKKSFQLGGGGFSFMSLLMYVEGNETESLMWWNICAAYDPDCKAAKDEAFAKATQSERKNAQKMSNDCVDSNFENCGWTN